MTFQDSLAMIAEDKELSGQTLRVFMLALSELEFENYLPIRQVDMAKKLEMHKTDVSKAIKQLVDKGIILKVKEGSLSGYKLNAHYGWKGSVANMEKEKHRIFKQHVINLKDYLTATENGK